MLDVLNQIAKDYPIGSVVQLQDDYAGDTHEIVGYNCLAEQIYILFKDGHMLDHRNTRLIKSVLA